MRRLFLIAGRAGHKDSNTDCHLHKLDDIRNVITLNRHNNSHLLTLISTIVMSITKQQCHKNRSSWPCSQWLECNENNRHE